jgi:glycosyltransferase involved in cell wall biosynthesis
MGVAVDADALVVDEAAGGVMGKGTSAARNAAIWYAPDGYDPGKGVNGRRMAGESFLRGWFRHADVAEWVGVTHGPTDGAAFVAAARAEGRGLPARSVLLDDARSMAPLGTMFISGPNFSNETWRREVWGAAAYAICGVTHTISTKAVMDGAWHLRASPQMEWDAVICTSRAVKAAVGMQMDLIDAFLLERFGSVPPRLQLPVIPLGVDCDAFAPDAAAGGALREELGIGAEDAVALVVARLSPHEKFDPLPVYVALQRAQAGTGRRLHLILYGRFPDGYSRRIFMGPAAELMPDVRLHHVEHQGPARRRAVLSAAEMFLFLIDNLQESFGIAPVEAMAAGLPVVASDWDGIRDTVDGGAGIRVPTTGARAEHVAATGLRYHGGTDSYIQYLSQVSAVTEIDVGKMAEAVRALIVDADLRARMGAAGRARARALFDWSVVVTQMQDLFAELEGRRRVGLQSGRFGPVRATHLPVAPSPMAYCGAFPTELLPEGVRYVWHGGAVPVGRVYALRDYAPTRRFFESQADVERVAAALRAVGAATAEGIARDVGFRVLKVERCLLWLCKYGFAMREG